MADPPENQNQNFIPDLGLLSGEQYFQICVPLREAVLEGNWKKADSIFRANRDRPMLHMAITKKHLTILHVAAGARRRTFVQKIIDLMEPNDERLLLQDRHRNNAFCYAAAAGDVKIAKLMLTRYPELPTIRGNSESTPLYMAVMCGHKKMAAFLYDETEHMMTSNDRTDLFFKSITTGMYDITLRLLNSRARSVDDENNELAAFNAVELAVARVDNDENGETALHILARRSNSMTPDAIKLVKCLWKKVTSTATREVANVITHPTKLLFDAAKLGNFEFLAVLVRSYPDLINQLDNGLSIFHVAIAHRHTKIFSLIYKMGFDKRILATCKDDKDNNMLHLAATYPNPPPASIVVPGAALELQQELLLFAEVKKIMQPSWIEKKNKINRSTEDHTYSIPTESCLLTVGHRTRTEGHTSTLNHITLVEGDTQTGDENIRRDGDAPTVVHSTPAMADTREGYTPQELFTQTHKDLKERGEQWMKSTAKSCMLVATLIATVVFAAAFTVPGGYNESANGNNKSGGGNSKHIGRPIHLEETFFKVFAVSDAIALSSSVISILFFLAILTSRYEEKDFRMRLPIKLMFGLLTLFASVTAMMIAFSSTFFLFYYYRERVNWITVFISVLVSIPVTLYVGLQFSLLIEIICSTCCFRKRFKPKSLPV